LRRVITNTLANILIDRRVAAEIKLPKWNIIVLRIAIGIRDDKLMVADIPQPKQKSTYQPAVQL